MKPNTEKGVAIGRLEFEYHCVVCNAEIRRDVKSKRCDSCRKIKREKYQHKVVIDNRAYFTTYDGDFVPRDLEKSQFKKYHDFNWVRIQAIRDFIKKNNCIQNPVLVRTAFYAALLGNATIERHPLNTLEEDPITWQISTAEFNKQYDLLKKCYELPEDDQCYIDDRAFIDSSRKTEYNRGITSYYDYLSLVPKEFESRFYKWRKAEHVPMIICEKDGHHSVFGSLCEKEHVDLCTSKGTLSRAWSRAIVELIVEHVMAGRTVHVGYVGDFDPAGIYRIERGLQNELATLLKRELERRQYGSDEVLTEGRLSEWLENYNFDNHVKWERVLVTQKQFMFLDENKQIDIKHMDKEKGEDDDDVVANKKFSDTTTERFIEEYFPDVWPQFKNGTKTVHDIVEEGIVKCAEVEAFSLEEQRTLVTEFIDKVRDMNDESLSESDDEEFDEWFLFYGIRREIERWIEEGKPKSYVMLRHFPKEPEEDSDKGEEGTTEEPSD